MKKAMILVLCLTMLALAFAGCASTPTTGTPSSSANPSSEETTTLGPPAEIVVVFPLLAGMPADLQKVNDAINELTVAKANVKVILTPTSVVEYNAQIPMMITGGEQIDLMETMPGGPASYKLMISQGQLIDITDLAPQYAQESIDVFNSVNPGFLPGAYVGGKMYGFPALFDRVSNVYFDIRKDVIEASNLTDSFMAIKNGADLEAVVKTLSENNDIPVLCASFGNATNSVLIFPTSIVNYDDFSKNITSEFFGDANWALGAIIGDDNTNVINMYTSEYYTKMLNVTHDWYQKGYISQDTATQTESSAAIIKANGALGSIGSGELGHQNSVSAQVGLEMLSVPVNETTVNTGSIHQFMWTLPITCKNEEAALRFLNLTFTDAEVLDMINFGIKDVHYVENTDGTISYPEGVTIMNSPYNFNSSFLFGNQFITKVFAPDAPDLRDQALALNKAAKTSKLMGFSVDSANMVNECTSVTNVISQYVPGLNSGTSDPATVLPEFLAALDAAGMPKIIEEVQTQVDAFVSSQN